MKLINLLFLGWLFLVSCNQEVVQQPGQQLVAAQGVVVNLAERPAPKITHLDRAHSPIKKLKWKPVKTTSRSFHVIMNTYQYEQGLPLDHITALITDSLGNLWLGSPGKGASRYDGTRFSDLNGRLKQLGRVFSILEDNDKNLWFGTEVGLVKFDGISLVTYTQKDGLSGKVNCAIKDHKGDLWFGTDHGVSIFSGNTFRTFSTQDGLIGSFIQALYEDPKGVVWIGTRTGLSRYDGKFKSYTIDQNLPSDNILSIGAEKNGTLWVGTDLGASRLEGQHFVTFTTRDGLADNLVKVIFRDRQGTLWFGTYGGLSQLRDSTFLTIAKDQGLCSNMVEALTDDANDNLWIATKGGGICRYPGQAFVNYAKEQGMPALVWGFLRAKNGLLWLGTEGNGVYSSDGKSWNQYNIAQSQAADTVRSLFEDSKGALWFGTTQNGVAKFDGSSLTMYTTKQGLAGDNVHSIYEDPSGALWLGTDSGISKFDGKSFTNYTVSQGLAGDNIFGIMQDKTGALWFASFGGGISRFDGNSFTNFTTAQGLPTNRLYNILEDNAGIFWITSEAGLIRYDGHSFLTYSVAQGLPDNSIYRVTITKEGNLLIGTNDGLVLFSGFTPKTPTFVKATPRGNGTRLKVSHPVQNGLSNADLVDFSPIFEIYSEKTGYPIIDSGAGQYTLYRDWDDTFWNGCSSEKIGISQINLSSLIRPERAPLLQIKAVDIDNQSIDWLSLKKVKNADPAADKFRDIQFDSVVRFYQVPQGLVLPYIHNNVTFHFAAIEPALPVHYQFMLEGYDRDWSPVTDRLQANFGNIFEGTYSFKLKARSAFGVWSEPTTYVFTVLPPWYRTWWAYLSYGTSSFLLLFGIYRWRTYALRKRRQELEELYRSSERFLPKDFLLILNKKSIQEVNLGDSAQVEMQIMFSDIRGFTTLTESLGPARTALVLNKYMGYMAPIVRKYEGVVGQFLGDGILAFFDLAPEHAIDAALEMQRALDEFNKDIAALGLEPVDIGIGLNGGNAMFSIIGEAERLEGLVISDSVNLSARIESLNKYYHTRFLITGAVYDKIADPERYLIRLIDKIVVKGKTQSAKIYEVEPLPAPEDLPIARDYVALFERGFAAYESGDFASAERAFSECLRRKPSDRVAHRMRERCLEFQVSGVPVGWDGTHQMTEK